MKVAIICAQGLEECEALVIYDLLYRANIDTKLIGLEKEVTSSHNVTFQTHLTIDEFKPEEYDCLFLPGGMPGTLNLEASKKVLEMIDYFFSSGKYIAAICAAPSILIHKGLVKEGKFICFPGFENGLKTAECKTTIDEKIITGKGLGAAFEMGHLIIETLVGKEKADEVIKKIQY